MENVSLAVRMRPDGLANIYWGKAPVALCVPAAFVPIFTNAPGLHTAAREVVEAWESGDLAAAVRELASYLDSEESDNE